MTRERIALVNPDIFLHAAELADGSPAGLVFCCNKIKQALRVQFAADMGRLPTHEDEGLIQDDLHLEAFHEIYAKDSTLGAISAKLVYFDSPIDIELERLIGATAERTARQLRDKNHRIFALLFAAEFYS